MVGSITKGAWKIQTPEEIPQRLEAAFDLATKGRPGPVLLDVPMDIQRSEISDDRASLLGQHPVAPMPDELFWKHLGEEMRRAQRPLILIGGGVRSGLATELLREFATQSGIPVVHSLMGVDVLPYAHPLRMGMIGSYGNRWANWAIGTADFLLVLGSRLDVRQTGSETQAFKGERIIYHVDCDAGEINNRIVGCESVVCQLRDFLADGIKKLSGSKLFTQPQWLAQIEAKRQEWPDIRESTQTGGLRIAAFSHLRRHGIHGFRLAGSHRCGFCPTQRSGGGHRGRWGFPMQHSGIANRKTKPPAHEDCDHQQPLSRHGSAVSGKLL
jgi:acetolactate synthase-1/2/3 large subunit